MKQSHIILVLALLVHSGMFAILPITWAGNIFVGDDVANQDLILDGDVQLLTGVHNITATTANVHVTMINPSVATPTNKSAITIRGDDLGGATTLNIIEANGFEVIFHVDNANLRFRGGNDIFGANLIVNVKKTSVAGASIAWLCNNH